MITKIENGIVTIKAYGFSEGKYPVEEFTAEDWVIERNILQGYLMYVPKIDPTVQEILKIKSLEKLTEKISTIIDDKIDMEDRKS